jgi:tRNA A37 threonylcarbamoyltransferase TsaD
MRKGSIGYMERIVEVENLARLIYRRTHECVVPESASRDYMQNSKHPTEKACYNAAIEIIDRYLK